MQTVNKKEQNYGMSLLTPSYESKAHYQKKTDRKRRESQEASTNKSKNTNSSQIKDLLNHNIYHKPSTQTPSKSSHRPKTAHRKVKSEMQQYQNTYNSINLSYLKDCFDRNPGCFLDKVENEEEYHQFLVDASSNGGIKRSIVHPLIRYPYSKDQSTTTYNYYHKENKTPKVESLNLEKESLFKRQTPVKQAPTSFMTTNKNCYVKHNLSTMGEEREDSYSRERRTKSEMKCPFPKHSVYQQQFQDWGKQNGKLVEKRPQYPVYTLNFRGISKYKEDCNKTEGLIKEMLKRRIKVMEDSQIPNMRASITTRLSQQKDKSIEKDYLITSKMKDVDVYAKKLESMKVNGYGTVDMSQFKSRPMHRPSSAHLGNLTVIAKELSTPQHFNTFYKNNFGQPPKADRPIYVPYP